MEQIDYETRYLIMIISSVINGKRFPTLFKRLNWEKIFSLAELHNVAGTVYIGLLGEEDEASPEIRELFFEKYKKQLLLDEVYTQAEAELREIFETQKLHGMIFSSEPMCALYSKREMRAKTPIEIWVENEQLFPFVNLLEGCDYEVTKLSGENEIFMERIPGVNLILYGKLPLKFLKNGRKLFPADLKIYDREPGMKYVHKLDKDLAYIYMIQRMAERYALGQTRIFEVADLWTLLSGRKKNIQNDNTDRMFKKLRLLNFEQCMAGLGEIWFGGLYMEEYALYNAIEQYIFSQGRLGREESKAILPLIEKLDIDRKKEMEKARLNLKKNGRTKE